MMSGIETDPTKRFSKRVTYYRRYRPGYPAALADYLLDAGYLPPKGVIADIGAGTGLLSQLFVDRGCTVYGVEPNPDMRAAAEAALACRDNFISVAAAAEATTLPADSVDLVLAGQAFHWFDLARIPAEFRRILRPPWRVGIVYNQSVPGSPWHDIRRRLRPFDADKNHPISQNRDPEAERARFFAAYDRQVFENGQVLDYEGLVGRILSMSSKPLPGQPNYERMMAEIEAIFAQHEQGGQVTLAYETVLYIGQLA